MTLMERLLAAGYPRAQMYHHESDLYVFATPLTMRVVEEWCKEKGFTRSWQCPMFGDQDTGRPMFVWFTVRSVLGGQSDGEEVSQNGQRQRLCQREV